LQTTTKITTTAAAAEAEAKVTAATAAQIDCSRYWHYDHGHMTNSQKQY